MSCPTCSLPAGCLREKTNSDLTSRVSPVSSSSHSDRRHLQQSEPDDMLGGDRIGNARDAGCGTPSENGVRG